MSVNIRRASNSDLYPEIFMKPQVQICVRKYSWSLKFKSVSGNIREASSSNLVRKYSCGLCL